jgi:hypothetical protein
MLIGSQDWLEWRPEAAAPRVHQSEIAARATRSMTPLIDNKRWPLPAFCANITASEADWQHAWIFLTISPDRTPSKPFGQYTRILHGGFPAFSLVHTFIYVSSSRLPGSEASFNHFISQHVYGSK